ncbi:heavy-metal-associated domain-containing protein [Thermodesulfovibrio thiophilus]|uniref:heavy-metal-associated domain-containing protein n=1 Tax=Thermodesulfovibrio thiophilus TaxID=340095 RepID=UPI00041CDD2F|nr:heavy-metal-associated domain-containing protein [Thermodesulfovibrio thiophilus]
MKEMKIFIEGMSCAHCVKRVYQALKNADVEEADVKIGEAKIAFDENKTNMEKIAKSIEEAGYKLKN